MDTRLKLASIMLIDYKDFMKSPADASPYRHCFSTTAQWMENVEPGHAASLCLDLK